MRKHSIFWGIILLGGGVLLLLNALGIGTQYELVPMLGSLLLLAISVASLIRLNFVMGFLPLAVISYLWRVKIGLPDKNIWLVFVAALLLGIGLSSIFWKAKRARFTARHNHGDKWGRGDGCGHADWSSSGTVTSSEDGEFVDVDSNFGEHVKYVRSTNLKKVKIDGNFSSIKVYFDQCQVSPEGAAINVDCNFAGVVLYVPRTWNIDNQMHVFAGSVDGISLSSTGNIAVALIGEVHFGEVKIVYL